MKDLEHQKALLLTKIEAHRTILGLEIRAARAGFDPVGTTLSLLGLDHAVAEIFLPILRAVTTIMAGHTVGTEGSETTET